MGTGSAIAEEMIDTVRRDAYIPSPMMKKPVAILVMTLAFWISCEVPVEPKVETDPVGDIVFTYLQDQAEVYVSAGFEDPFNGVSVSYVRLLWYGIRGLNHDDPDSIFLNDHGDFGDILRDDNVYSRKIPTGDLKNALTYTDTGDVYLEVSAMYLDSALYALADSFSLGNIIPRIDSLDAPDTLRIPASGLRTDTIRVWVSDADGLEDIKWVGFRSLRPDGTYANRNRPIFLYDDGGEVILLEPDITSGDLIEGDGIYSYVVVLHSQTTPGSYIWTFQAQDLGNAYSNVVTHTVSVQ